METPRSCNMRHSRGLLFNIARIINDRDDQTIYKDLNLICRDGIVRWNKFLLVANSPILRHVLDPGKTLFPKKYGFSCFEMSWKRLNLSFHRRRQFKHRIAAGCHSLDCQLNAEVSNSCCRYDPKKYIESKSVKTNSGPSIFVRYNRLCIKIAIWNQKKNNAKTFVRNNCC